MLKVHTSARLKCPVQEGARQGSAQQGSKIGSQALSKNGVEMSIDGVVRGSC